MNKELLCDNQVQKEILNFFLCMLKEIPSSVSAQRSNWCKLQMLSFLLTACGNNPLSSAT